MREFDAGSDTKRAHTTESIDELLACVDAVVRAQVGADRMEEIEESTRPMSSMEVHALISKYDSKIKAAYLSKHGSNAARARVVELMASTVLLMSANVIATVEQDDNEIDESERILRTRCRRHLSRVRRRRTRFRRRRTVEGQRARTRSSLVITTQARLLSSSNALRVVPSHTSTLRSRTTRSSPSHVSAPPYISFSFRLSSSFSVCLSLSFSL